MKNSQLHDPHSTGARIGLLVRHEREAAGLSLTTLALETGLSRTFLSRLERGEFADVKVAVLVKLTHRFPLTVAEFCATTGCNLSTDLPGIEAYLRARHPEWPAAAVSQVADYCRYNEARYDEKDREPRD